MSVSDILVYIQLFSKTYNKQKATRDMQASALVYCKKSPKRVLLVSEDESLEEEIEGILSQINLPKVLNRQTNLEKESSTLKELNPHMAIVDCDSCPDISLIRRSRQFDPELPLLLIHRSEELSSFLKGEADNGVRIMKRDTVRFSGQIFYKSIHSYAIKNFQQQRENTYQKIDENIQGLQEVREFWEADAHQIDPSYKKVLAELSSTLNYLEMLKQEFHSSDQSADKF